MTGDGPRPERGCRRVFLGWQRPLIESAAAWLHERAAESPTAERALSFESQLVVVPGRRAGRLLLQRLAALADVSSLVPPAITTIGVLPELLLEQEPAAGGVDALCVRLETLRTAPPEQLRPVFPEPPPRDDLETWLGLAEELERIERELAAELLTPADVARRLGGAPSRERTRWRSIEALQARYEQRLASRGIVTRAVARAAGLAAAVAAGERDRTGGRSVVLVGLTELSGLSRRLLELVAPEPTALVAAPGELEDLFDPWGAPDQDRWLARTLSVDRAELVAADGPAAQAGSVAARVSAWIAEEGARPDEVTVAVGAALTLPLVDDAARRAGLAVHVPTGPELSRSEPMIFLRRLARYLKRPSAEALGDLTRLPVVEDFLDRSLAEGWLIELDRELASGPSPSDGPPPRGAQVTAVAAALAELVPADHRPWSATAEVALARLYGDYRFEALAPADAQNVAALEAIADVLAQVERAIDGRRFDLADGVEVLERLLSTEPGVEVGHGDGVELLGWLDLALDDAPWVAVTDVNEGVLPAATGPDPFLTEGLRERLGLASERRRTARDLLHLEQLLHSRRHVVLGWARRDADGQPLEPSRLLLHRRGRDLARSVLAIAGAAPDRAGERLWQGAPASGFHTPRPEPPFDLPRRLPVTAFRDYLVCPYRFFLKRVLGLEPPRPTTRELAADLFGSLAHEVLGRFGRGELATSTDATAIETELVRLLEELAGVRLADGGALVALQIAQLERRLRVFARWQAGQSAAGWSIEPRWVERPIELELEVDGEATLIVGRIDRVDRSRDGHLRVLDYKTGERAEPPHSSHGGPYRGRTDRPWVDLQLPLYGLALRQSSGTDEWPELAAYAMSKKLDADPLLAASWTDAALESAMEVARDVVRRIRAAVFWPPGEPPSWDDGFADIVGDRFAQRYRRHAADGGVVR